MKRLVVPARFKVMGGAAAFVLAVAFARCLPNPLFTTPFSTVMVTTDGELLGAKIASDGQWRFPLSETVPERFVAALTTYEDSRFYHHVGVDYLAVMRALYLNLAQQEVVSGASTITMQVIRMARSNPRRTYFEKIVEMIWAVRLELRHTKEEILALYAAHAPFGGNVVGLETAAWRYFSRHPEDLSWAEAATLAVLPNSPSLVHPGRNRLTLEERRNGLLQRLHETGHLDEVELQLAMLEPLPENPKPLPQNAPHLLETLTANAAPGAYRFTTTLDASLQRAAGDILVRHSEILQLKGINNAAALIIDNETFDVVAYVGNSAWAVDEGHGYAIDLVHRPRSTGSILKPILFANMLDAGEILPQSLIPDLPTQYAGYIPENYDKNYRGAVPARMALAQSLNVPAVRMLRYHGVDRFYDALTRMGMSTLYRSPDGYGLTLILGGAEGTLWDLTGIYANIAHAATVLPYSGRDVQRIPRVLAESSSETNMPQSISTGAAWLTLEALVEVTRPGVEGNWRNFGGSQNIAWKTGTSYGLRDGWAIGSNAGYTIGVWAGNATGEGRPELTGVTTAAPILFDLFGLLDHAEWFERPDFALKEVEICKNDGYLRNGDCEIEVAFAPRNSHFESPSSNHQLVHLDPTGQWRVHARCESVDRMQHRSWFILPAGQEFYYRRYHTNYRSLPQYREDCLSLLSESDTSSGPIDFLYPNTGTKVYIPIDLSGERGRVVFEAAHRDPDATLFWHIDERFLGTTRTFHEQALDITQGLHTITVVDEEGNRLSRAFEVLARGGP